MLLRMEGVGPTWEGVTNAALWLGTLEHANAMIKAARRNEDMVDDSMMAS